MKKHLQHNKPSFDFDAIDIRILTQLQKDGSLSNVELAQRVGLSPSPCLARVRMLEAQGVILGRVTLLDPLSVGANISVFIQVTLERQTEAQLEKFEETIFGFSEVMECYLMTGDADYHLRVVVPDLMALQHFIVGKLSKTSGVSNIRSSFALKQVKYKTALPLVDLLDAGAAQSQHSRTGIRNRNG